MTYLEYAQKIMNDYNPDYKKEVKALLLQIGDIHIEGWEKQGNFGLGAIGDFIRRIVDLQEKERARQTAIDLGKMELVRLKEFNYAIFLGEERNRFEEITEIIKDIQSGLKVLEGEKA